METITESCVKILVCSCNKERWVLCSRNFAPEISFLGHRKRHFVGVSRSNSLLRKKFRPIFAASALSESNPQTQIADEEIQINDIEKPKSVRVRFKLRKECAFGQQFVIVGDDPVFGLWDPSEAVPLNWSEGHVWSVELDLPSGKVIKYKFILKGGTQEILWQTGPDRVVQIWETEKMITVSEDWDNPELQMIIEEEPVSDPSEEPTPAEAEELAAENITEEKGEPNSETQDELSSPLSGSYAEKEDEVVGNDGRAINESNSLSSTDEATPSSDEGVPILVPGLTLMPEEETQEESLREVQKKNASNILDEPDKAESSDLQGLKEEHVSALLHPAEAAEIKIDNKKEPYTDEYVEKRKPDQAEEIEEEEEGIPSRQELQNSVLESDLQWGQRTLQKFLSNFGFL